MVDRRVTNSKFSNGLASSDAHNVVSLGVDPTDGTIHVAYDLHNNTLKYVRSIAGATTGATWNASVFNAQTSALIGTTNITSVTYPQFVRTQPMVCNSISASVAVGMVRIGLQL